MCLHISLGMSILYELIRNKRIVFMKLKVEFIPLWISSEDIFNKANIQNMTSEFRNVFSGGVLLEEGGLFSSFSGFRIYCKVSRLSFEPEQYFIYVNCSQIASSPYRPSAVLHPPDCCGLDTVRLQAPAFHCQLCWVEHADIFTCTSFNEWNTDTHRATSVHSRCLQAVRAPRSTPLEEKHQLSAERDIVNQAPSSQWCGQTCINVRAEAGEGRGTWRSPMCANAYGQPGWAQKSHSQPWTITQYDYICKPNVIIQ